MYCKIEEKTLKRVNAHSGIYESFSYDVPEGADYRRGVWRLENEIVNTSGREAWTLSVRNSYRREGRVMKRSVYLLRVSRKGIIDAFKQSVLDDVEFDFFSLPVVQKPALAKFPTESEHVLALVKSKIESVVDMVVAEFMGTLEYACFTKYVALKREVDAKIRQLNEEDAKSAEEESRKREEYQRKCDEQRGSSRCDEQKPKTTHKDRSHGYAMEVMHKVVRAAKKKFHPDLTKDGDSKTKQEKSIIAGEIVDGAMSLLDGIVDREYEAIKD